MSTPGRQRRLAERVRREVARRLLDRNLLTYDDLLIRLQDTLADPERGRGGLPAAPRPLPGRARRRVPGHRPGAVGGRPPGLRWRADHPGAHRRSEAGDLRLPRRRRLRLSGGRPARATTASPWPRTGAATQACSRPTTPCSIPFTSAIPRSPTAPVAATAAHRRPGLLGGPRRRAPPGPGAARGRRPGPADLEGRAKRRGPGLGRRRPGRRRRRRCCRRRPGIVEWRGAEEGARAGVSPGDIAVLVRTNRQAGLVQAALRAAGVPAVVGGTESVFASPSAGHWLRLLEALEQPASRPRAVAVALTPFVGMTADEVAGADEATWEAAARPPAPLGRHPAPAGCRHRDPGHPGRPRGCRPGCCSTDRRARAHRPRPHRRVAARRGVRRPARPPCPPRLAGPPHRGGRRRDRRRRGPQPATRLRRRRGAGPDHPPGQGARVPRRLLPVPVGQRAGPAEGPAGGVPRPDRRATAARWTWAWPTPAPSYLRHFAAAHDEQRGRGSPAPLRGAHPGPPPGGDLVGPRLRVPALPARPAADESATQTATWPPAPTYSPNEAAVQRRLEAVAARVPGRISVERCTALPTTRWDGAAAARRPRGRPLRAQPRPGLAPHVVQRHHRRRSQRQPWAASPRLPGSPTSPTTPALTPALAEPGRRRQRRPGIGPGRSPSSGGDRRPRPDGPVRARLLAADSRAGAEIGTFVHSRAGAGRLLAPPT